jgi:hypothetical protein
MTFGDVAAEQVLVLVGEQERTVADLVKRDVVRERVK